MGGPDIRSLRDKPDWRAWHYSAPWQEGKNYEYSPSGYQGPQYVPYSGYVEPLSRSEKLDLIFARDRGRFGGGDVRGIGPSPYGNVNKFVDWFGDVGGKYGSGAGVWGWMGVVSLDKYIGVVS